MELEVYNINGDKTSKKVKLDDAIFGIEPNDHAIYLDVKQHMANKRQGTHSSKERNAVTGSRRKIKRQKGTGSARAGDIKNPIFRGGGKTFGPHPRIYNFKLNKKLKRLAKLSALSYKAKEKSILVIEDFSFETPKTKNYLDMLNNFDLANKKTLLVSNKQDKNIYLASRNLQKTKVVNVRNLNTYDLLDANSLLILESTVNEIGKLNS